MRPFLLPLICVLTAGSLARGGDWPCFRGPERNGISQERGINKEWNQKVPKTLWKIALSGKTGELFVIDASNAQNYPELGRFTPLGGQNWVAPIIANGRLYIRNQKELACIDLK